MTYIFKLIFFPKELNVGKSIKATGGGSHKYKDLIGQKLGIK
jgi:hypothetical protein